MNEKLKVKCTEGTHITMIAGFFNEPVGTGILDIGQKDKNITETCLHLIVIHNYNSYFSHVYLCTS